MRIAVIQVALRLDWTMTASAGFHYVFGPVPSRRLGRSLGVDLVPAKTCTLDCLYCQAGRTTQITLERKEYVPTAAVIAELERKISEKPSLDAVTFSGSGEPTLHSKIAEVIAAVKRLTRAPAVVLTNGTLLSNGDVRRDLRQADIVMPSLDAPDEGTFRRVNRPHPGLDFEKYVRGLVDFTGEFPGRVLLEIFFVRGVNASDEAARKLAELARRIGPDEVHLNTVVRPVPGGDVERVSPERLEEIRALFGESAKIIADAALPATGGKSQGAEAELLALIARRPVTAEDAAAALVLDMRESRKILDALTAEGRAKTIDKDGKIFYFKNT